MRFFAVVFYVDFSFKDFVVHSIDGSANRPINEMYKLNRIEMQENISRATTLNTYKMVWSFISI